MATNSLRLARIPARALGAERTEAVRDAWRALWWSRLVVWVAGVGALVSAGPHRGNRSTFDPGGLTAPFGGWGDAFLAPSARWDSVWYLVIAGDGYPDDDRLAFFPLYPLLVRLAGAVVGSPVAGGVAVSLLAFLGALYLLHRLTELELGADAARATVWLCALFPMSFFFSAVYSESLFLLLSVGAVYAARLRRWPAAGALGLLAAGTRSAGVLLLVPLVLEAMRAGGEEGGRRWSARRLRGPPLAALWLLLVPVGPPAYFEIAAGDPFSVAGHNITLFALLLGALAAAAAAIRSLPTSYGAYVAVMLALPLSFPVSTQPLMSLPRFLAVLFPLFMWGGLRLSSSGCGRESGGARSAADRRRARGWSLGISGAALAAFSAQFACWVWVA